MKDYYDIYYLANKFDFDGKMLIEALRRTFQNREHNFAVEQFEQVMSFDEDAAMQKNGMPLSVKSTQKQMTTVPY